MEIPVISQTTIDESTSRRHRAKFANKNPIHRLSLNHYFNVLSCLIDSLQYTRVLDFGCGEGFCLGELRNRGACENSSTKWTGIDLRPDAVETARMRFPSDEFICTDLFDSQLDDEQYDVILCTQVLEHLPGPERYVSRLVSLSSRYLVFSVPHEPWFCLMNFLRGRDVLRLGNHPEHINHWSGGTFKNFLNLFVEVVAIRRPFPFLIVVGEKRTKNPDLQVADRDH